MLEEGQKQIFLALEMGIDRSLAPVRQSGDLIQLGASVSVPYEDLFCGIQKAGLRLPGSEAVACFEFPWATSLI